MAVRKTTAARKKAAPKKAPARRSVARGKSAVGDTYQCDVCGLAVTVDEACGCSEAHELICCSEPMRRMQAA